MWDTQHPSHRAGRLLKAPRKLHGQPNPPPSWGAKYPMAQPQCPVPQATQTRCVMVPSRLSRLQTRASAWALGSSTGRQVKARPQSSKEKSRPWGDGEPGGGHREGVGVKWLRAQGSQVGSHHVQNEDPGVPQDIGGHHLGGESRRQSPGTGQPLPRAGDRPLTVQPARALRCSAATSRALRVAPPLPSRAHGSSTARRSAGGRGPRLPLSRRDSSSAKREAGGAEGWHPRPRPGGRGRAPAPPLASLEGGDAAAALAGEDEYAPLRRHRCAGPATLPLVPSVGGAVPAGSCSPAAPRLLREAPR